MNLEEKDKVISEATKLNQQFTNENPVDVIEISKSLGFVVGNSILNPEDEGFIFVDETKDEIFGIKTSKLIGINSNRTLGWKRFIVAREIGRYILEYKNREAKDLYAYKDSASRFDVRKNKIDLFAINLLMPAKILKKCITKQNAFMAIMKRR